MRVLVIASFPDSIVPFRGHLLAAMQAGGHEVHVAAPGLGSGSTVRGELEARGIVVHEVHLERTSANPLSDLRTLLQLWRVATRVRPGTVLCYTVKPVIYGMLAAWLAGVPRRFALITGLGYTFAGQRRGVVSGIARFLYRSALRRADKVFVQNPDDEALLRAIGILPPQVPSVIVNGSGVDTVHYGPAPLPTGAPSFLMIARLLGDKGVREYARAASDVRRRHPEVAFRLAGWIDDGPDAIAGEELARWVDAGDIDYLGHLDDVRPAVAAASVYVLPSYREGTPRTVLEAMSMGRPVITTDAPGCRETVVDGENGFLVEPGSVDRLAAAMQRFVDDPAQIDAMGRRSRQLVEDRYDVHEVNRVMMREMGLS